MKHLCVILGPVILGLVILGFCGAPASALPDLLPVPEPPVRDMEEAVRNQLQDALGSLRELSRRDGLPIGELAEAYGETGRLFLAYDLIDSAQACFQNAHRLRPDDFRWPYLLGTVLSNDRRVEEALTALLTALELRPEDLATGMRLGDVHLARDDAKAARKAFEKVLQEHPETAAAHAGLGRAAAAEGAFGDAVEHYERALALEPRANSLRYPLAISLRELGRLDEARRQLAQRGDVQVRFKDPLTRDLLELATGAGIQLMFGHRALRNGQAKLAIRRFRQAIEANPQSAEAHQALGAVLAQEGDFEGAVRHDSASLAIRPENPTVHYNLGTVLLERGEAQQAIRHFQVALNLVPDFDNARFNLATALAQNGSHEQALPLFQELLKSEPEDRATRFFAANTYYQLRQYAAAATLLDELIQHDANALRPRLLRARVALASGEDETARRQLETVLNHPQASSEQRIAAHRQLGNLEARVGHYENAAEFYLQAVAAAPENATTRFALGMAWLLAERYSEAAALLQESAMVLPSNIELNHLRARFLATCPLSTLRDGPQALEISRRVFQANPHPEMAETVAMAHAELGQFAEAIRWQRRLLGEVERAGHHHLLPPLQKRLALYEEHKPCRAPWLARPQGSNP